MNNVPLIQFFLPLFWLIGFFVSALNTKKYKIYASLGAGCYLYYCIKLLLMLNNAEALLSARVTISHTYNLSYAISFDHINAVLIMINALTLLLICLISWKIEIRRSKLYYSAIFLIVWAINGALLSENLIMFYLLSEFLLIPLFVLLTFFNDGDKENNAGLTFFIVNAIGSVLILGALVFMSAEVFKLTGNYNLTVNSIQQIVHAKGPHFLSGPTLVFWALCIAYFIRTANIPFHFWMPKIFATTSIAGLLLIGGAPFLLGAYAFVKFIIPAFGEILIAFKGILVIWALAGIIYGAIMALLQKELKPALAFYCLSSISYITMGILLLNEISLSGTIIQLAIHPLTMWGYFLVAQTLVARRTNQIGRMFYQMPRLGILFLLITAGAMSIPATGGFIGKFLICWGAYKAHIVFCLLGVLAFIIIMTFALNLYHRLMLCHNENATEAPPPHDLSTFEIIPLALIAVAIILLGIFPSTIFNFLENAFGPIFLNLQGIGAI